MDIARVERMIAYMIVGDIFPRRHVGADLDVQTAVCKYGQEALCYRETASATHIMKKMDVRYSYSHANATNGTKN